MKKPRLTLRRLEAMRGALASMLAGEVGEGDWPQGAKSEDMQAALDWVAAQIAKRTAK